MARRLLTDQQARRLRELAAEGVPVKVVAAAFGISREAAVHIVRGTNYVDAGGPIRTRDHRGDHMRERSPLTESAVASIKAELFLGASIRRLARTYQVGTDTVAAIKRDTSWRHVPCPLVALRRETVLRLLERESDPALRAELAAVVELGLPGEEGDRAA